MRRRYSLWRSDNYPVTSTDVYAVSGTGSFKVTTGFPVTSALVTSASIFSTSVSDVIHLQTENAILDNGPMDYQFTAKETTIVQQIEFHFDGSPTVLRDYSIVANLGQGDVTLYSQTDDLTKDVIYSDSLLINTGESVSIRADKAFSTQSSDSSFSSASSDSSPSSESSASSSQLTKSSSSLSSSKVTKSTSSASSESSTLMTFSTSSESSSISSSSQSSLSSISSVSSQSLSSLSSTSVSSVSSKSSLSSDASSISSLSSSSESSLSSLRPSSVSSGTNSTSSGGSVSSISSTSLTSSGLSSISSSLSSSSTGVFSVTMKIYYLPKRVAQEYVTSSSSAVSASSVYIVDESSSASVGTSEAYIAVTEYLSDGFMVGYFNMPSLNIIRYSYICI